MCVCVSEWGFYIQKCAATMRLHKNVCTGTKIMLTSEGTVVIWGQEKRRTDVSG